MFICLYIYLFIYLFIYLYLLCHSVPFKKQNSQLLGKSLRVIKQKINPQAFRWAELKPKNQRKGVSWENRHRLEDIAL